MVLAPLFDRVKRKQFMWENPGKRGELLSVLFDEVRSRAVKYPYHPAGSRGFDLALQLACLEVSAPTNLANMDSDNERNPLLGTRSPRTSAIAGVLPSTHRRALQPDDDDETGWETDEGTLNEMMAMFSTSVGSLGLDGAIQGAPMMRRGSIASVRPQEPRRRSRANNQALLPEDNAIEPGTCSNTARVNGRSPSFSKSPDVTTKVYLSRNSESVVPKRSEFLGGVSRARFWAVFSSILLVYLVSGAGAFKGV